jgi:hypothetical protein
METMPTNGNNSVNGDVSSIMFGTLEDDILQLDGGADKDTLLGRDSANTMPGISSNDLFHEGTRKVTIVFWSRQ